MAMRKDGIQTRKRKPKQQQQKNKEDIKTEGEFPVWTLDTAPPLEKAHRDKRNYLKHLLVFLAFISTTVFCFSF